MGYMERVEKLESQKADPEERYFSVESSISITENEIEDSDFFEAWTRFRFSQFMRFRVIQGKVCGSVAEKHRAWQQRQHPPTVGLIWFDPDFKSEAN